MINLPPTNSATGSTDPNQTWLGIQVFQSQRLPGLSRPMSLNIKDRDAHRLAEELGKLTGESMTTAVTIAVRERFDRVRQELLFKGDDFAQTDIKSAEQ
jgi:hypothetical protein